MLMERRYRGNVIGQSESFVAYSARYLITTLISFFFVAYTPFANANDNARRVYGPIVTWDADPTNSIRVTWVEGDQLTVAEKVKRSPLWRTGQAGFGYGDKDDKTVLEDMKDGYSRVYIRYEFDLDGADKDDNANLHIRYDDGFIAYLNGEEFVRKEIDKGRGKRARKVDSHEASGSKYRVIEIERWSSLARKGRNVLAIEGHNAKLNSSDFTLDPYLSLNGEDFIEKHAKWAYLAGRDPGPNWTARGYKPFESNQRQNVKPTTTPIKLDDTVYYREVGPRDRKAAKNSWKNATGTTRPFGDTEEVVRSVPITGLKPATDYEFVIGTKPTSRADTLRFRTAPRERPDEFSFVTGGDMSASKIARKMNRLAGELDPMFAMLGGDLAYANGKNLKAWHDWLNAWQENAITSDGRIVPMVIAIGNHEMGSELDEDRAKELGVPKNSQFFFSLFTLPTQKTNYVLNFGDYLSLVILDSDHSQKVTKQTQWLDEALASIEAFPFRYVCYHRPTFGTAKDRKDSDDDIMEEWVPLFEKHEPTVVFENDHHTLKRTHRIRDGKVDPTGVLYLGDGAWGVKTRDIKERKKKWYLANAAKENHLWLITMKGDTVDCQALDENGKELDRVEISDPEK